MSFYELYHAVDGLARANLARRAWLTEAMPLLLPDPKLMTKWLPSVRWGSLEYDHGQVPACLLQAQGQATAWMNQSTLASALEGDAIDWIAATDYYRFPHVMLFQSVASLLARLRSLPAASAQRIASQQIRAQALAFHRQVLVHLLGEASFGPGVTAKIFAPRRNQVNSPFDQPCQALQNQMRQRAAGIRCPVVVPARLASLPKLTFRRLVQERLVMGL